MLQNSNYYPTQSEYEALPPILKRKCFSTLERLRYAEAQAQAGSQVGPENKQSNQSPISKKFAFNRSVTRIRQGLQFSARNQQVKPVSKPEPTPTPVNVSYEDAIWFSQLPDKVKRGYFSLEEEKQFNTKRAEFTRPATKESIYKLDQTFNQSLPSLQDPSSCLSSTDESTEYSVFTEDEAEDEVDNMEIETTSARDWPQWDMDRALDDCRQIINKSKTFSTDTALSLDLYQPNSSSTAVESTSDYNIINQEDQNDALSTRSLKTLHRQRLNEWRSQWTPQNLPPVPPIPETATIQVFRPRKASIVSVSTARPKTAKNTSDEKTSTQELQKIVTAPEKRTSIIVPSIPSQLPTPPESPLLAEPKATHYTDPETRLKLRMYLASPSKFDEAVEFGFPSLPSPNESEAPSLKSTMTTSKAKHNRPAANIFTSYTDGISVTEVPLSPSPPCSILSDTSASYNDVQAQLRQLDRDPCVGTAGREMTIRMTLTRPDLRANGSILHPATYVAPGDRSGTAFASSGNFVRLQDLDIEEGGRDSLETRSSAIRRLWSRK